MSEDPQIKALLAELARHVDANREERVADIKAELAALGHRAGTATDGPSEVMETAVDPGAAKARKA